MDTTSKFTTRIMTFPGQEPLSFVYKEKHGENVFCELRDATGQVYSISQLWINNSPAQYIQDFKYQKLPERGLKWRTSSVTWKEGEAQVIFHLEINESEWPKMSIDVNYEDKKVSLTPSPYLLISGLKKLIKKDITNNYLSYPFKNYILNYKGYLLPDRCTLKECAIDKDEKPHVKIFLKEPFLGSDPDLQSKELSDFCSIQHLNRFTQMIDQKKKLACQIIGNGKCGTGVLIAQNLILSATHNFLPEEERGKKLENCDNFKAVFCFEEGANQIEIGLGKVIYSSPTPKKWEFASFEKLDFSIISLKFDPSNAVARSYLSGLAEMSHTVLRLGETQNREKIWKNVRANIIQHPDGMSKQIAFRENRINKAELFLLHSTAATDYASSGAPVFDDDGEFIGLHVSRCREINLFLIQKMKKLINELNLGNYKTEGCIYRSFEGCEDLEIYHSGTSKGICNLRGKEISWMKLIEEKAPREKDKTWKGARVWAHQFLNGIDTKVDRLHKNYCNTAIVADSIRQEILEAKLDLDKIDREIQLEVEKANIQIEIPESVPESDPEPELGWSLDDLKRYIIPVGFGVMAAAAALYAFKHFQKASR